MGTIELLIRTHLTLVAAEQGSQLQKVVGYGSGFMMLYRGYRFLVTAAHVNEPDWSELVTVKDIRNNEVAIVTHLSQEKDGVMKSVYVPIGGFTYINTITVAPDTTDFQAVLENAEKNPDPVDVAVALVEDRPGVMQFSNDEPDEETENLEARSKILIPYEAVVEPDKDDHYFVFGRVKFEPKVDDNGNPYVSSEPMLHSDMEYYSTINENVHVFKATEDVVYEEWAGISGSPVLNPNGYIVGIACSVLPMTPYMYALDIKTVRSLFDVLINDKLAEENQQT